MADFVARLTSVPLTPHDPGAYPSKRVRAAWPTSVRRPLPVTSYMAVALDFRSLSRLPDTRSLPPYNSGVRRAI